MAVPLPRRHSAPNAMAVAWQFEDAGGQWKDMAPEVSALMEQEWGLQRPTAQFTAGGSRYEVNFPEMRQRCLDDRTRVRRVRRNCSGRELVEATVREKGITIPFMYKAVVAAMAHVGIPPPKNPDDIFDFHQNKDFRGLADNGAISNRGGEAYRIPISWFGFGLNVLGRYDNGDNTWMKTWAAAYHGTRYEYIGSILAHGGLKAGPRQKYAVVCGNGIYCSPNLDFAAEYAPLTPVTVDGVTQHWQFALQCRVRPDVIRKGHPDIWVLNDPADIRPYRLLVRALASLLER